MAESVETGFWCVVRRFSNVNADPDRIDQLLGNLIGNALKFAPRHGEVRVGAVAAGDCVRFSVADTGPGIQAEDQSQVFERSWQVNGSESEGSGLGLAIAKTLPEAHGGRIGVDSVEGEARSSGSRSRLPGSQRPDPGRNICCPVRAFAGHHYPREDVWQRITDHQSRTTSSTRGSGRKG